MWMKSQNLGLPVSVIRRILCQRLFSFFIRIIIAVVLCIGIISVLLHSSNQISGNVPFHVIVAKNLEQDDPRLIQYIRRSKDFLVPPSTQPYNLTQPEIRDHSNMDIGKLIDHLFHNKAGGTFFEAGAFDGEHESHTLYLERFRNWTGVLVEASPSLQPQVLERHRKATLVKGCVSPEPHPMEVTFMDNGKMTSSIDGYFMKKGDWRFFKCINFTINIRIDDMYQWTDYIKNYRCKEMDQSEVWVTVKCVPLYSILLAAGIESLDYLSLDIEGAELKVLTTIPFEKIDIKVIRVEVTVMETEDSWDTMEKLFNAGYQKLTNYNGYYVTTVRDELIFVKEKHFNLV